MNPYELFGSYGSIYSFSDMSHTPNKKITGMNTLNNIIEYYTSSVWLNPDPQKYWNSTTCEAIWDILPMYYLSVDGLHKAIYRLKEI